MERLSVSERLYGLSLIWQEANSNFAYFDRVRDLDWDAAYQEYIEKVIAAEDHGAYYDLLSRFTALLKDGHTFIIAPKEVYLSQDRPQLMLMNIRNMPVVTNASVTLGQSIPMGSEIIEVDGLAAGKYLSAQILPTVFGTTPHRRQDDAVSRLLFGAQGSTVACKFKTPGGKIIAKELLRNRRISTEAWMRPPAYFDRWEFKCLDDILVDNNPDPSFDFKILEDNIAYVILNSFIGSDIVPFFLEKLPIIKRCSGVIIDLRKNEGGSDGNAYDIAAHFLQRPTETIRIKTRKHIALYQARGWSMRDTPEDRLSVLSDEDREKLLCYQRRWFQEVDWGNILPAEEVVQKPLVLLTDSETCSTAEDFIFAIQSGNDKTMRIGRGTAGSSGQPLTQELPGGGSVYICTVRMPWPDEVAQKGIEPHILVEPTVEDVIHREDRILKTAVDYLREHLVQE